MHPVEHVYYRFDSKLSEVRKANSDKELEVAMAGQLFFHLAQYLMISAKKVNYKCFLCN